MIDWIGTLEAAEMLGLSRGYFRRKFCNPEHPILDYYQDPDTGVIKVDRSEVAASRANKGDISLLHK